MPMPTAAKAGADCPATNNSTNQHAVIGAVDRGYSVYAPRDRSCMLSAYPCLAPGVRQIILYCLYYFCKSQSCFRGLASGALRPGSCRGLKGMPQGVSFLVSCSMVFARMIKAKEFLVASPIGGPLRKIASGTKRRIRTISNPELDAFYRDDDYLDRVLSGFIKPDFNCIDIGCHIGSVLKEFVDRAPNANHMAVEPTPAKAQNLRERFPTVTIFECALADEPGEAVFYEDTKRPGYSSLIQGNSNETDINAYTVKIRTLDDIAADAVRIDLIKIDVEGAELRVLQGGQSVIKKHRPIIIFECGPIDNSKQPQGGAPFGDDLFTYFTEQLDYNIFGAIDVLFDRPALTLPEFRRYRTYPFTALNFIAKPKA